MDLKIVTGHEEAIVLADGEAGTPTMITITTISVNSSRPNDSCISGL